MKLSKSLREQIIFYCLIGFVTIALFTYLYRVGTAQTESSIIRGSQILSTSLRNTLFNSVRDIKYLSNKPRSTLYEFAKLSPLYSQVRILNSAGQELYRLNHYGTSFVEVSKDQLQNKGERYYFQELKKIQDDQIYVGPIDNNIENGVVINEEITFRVGTRLNNGGYLVLNISSDYIKEILDGIKDFEISIAEIPSNEGLLAYLQGRLVKIIEVSPSGKEPHLASLTSFSWKLSAIFDVRSERKYIIGIAFGCVLIFILLSSLYRRIKAGLDEYYNLGLFYRKFIDSSTIFSITDKHGKITYANEMFQEISQYSKEELYGNDHRIINSGTHSKEFFKQMWDCLKDGKVWIGKIKNKKKDQSPYWVYSVIAPIENRYGEIEGYAALRFDITKEIELENKMKQFHAASVAGIGRMSASLSHQYSTPISALLSSAELLEMMLEDESKRNPLVIEQFNHIRETLNEMIELNNLIKQLARSSEDTPSQDDTSHLESVISHAVKLSEKSIRGNNVEVHFDPAAMDVYVFGQHILLAQIFINLISNSVFAIKGLKEKWIKIHIEKNEKAEEVLIRFQDSGEGISGEAKNQMFDSFFSTKDLSEGSGLGLAICKEIVGFFNGKIYYDKDEKNTTFAIVLRSSCD